MAEVKRILKNIGFPWHVVALEEVGGSALGKGSCGDLGGNTCQAPWALDSVPLLSSYKVFSLPPSVLCCASQQPAGTEEAYKAAVDSFLQQQHVLGAEACASLAQGEDQLHPPHSREPPSTAGYPKAAQTEALSRLFNSIKTLTAKEELLQTLR